MRVAIVGCGNIADTHAKVLKEMGEEIALCVDVNGAELFAKRWGAAEHTNDAFLVFARDIDVVHVCTPPALHYAFVKRCLMAGLHVFCEKPLCLEETEARELYELARDKGVVHAIGFNVRFHPTVQECADAVRRGNLGRILLVHGSYLQEFGAFPSRIDWRYNPALAGKMRAVTEIGSHWFDLAQFVSGLKIKSVCAQFGNFHPKQYCKDGLLGRNELPGAEQIEVLSEDAAAVLLRFEDGAMGCATLSEVSQGRGNRLALEVTGDAASFWWDSENNNAIYTGRKGEGVRANINPFGTGFADTHRGLFRRVYADIRKGRPAENAAYPTFSDGFQNVVLCEAVYKSAESGGIWVEV